MLSMNSVFENAKDKEYQELHFLVVLNSGSAIYAFSDIDMNFSIGSYSDHVYGTLLNVSGIKQSINIYSRKSSIGNVKLTFTNKIIDVDGTDRMSDMLPVALEDYTIYIFLMAGRLATSTNHCLLVFKGVPSARLAYNETHCIITAESSASKIHKMLPVEFIDDLTPTADDDEGKRIPLVMGSNAISIPWAKERDRNRCVRFSSTKWYLSDGEDYTTSNLWLYIPDIGAYGQIDSGDYTINDNDSGRTSVTIDDIEAVKASVFLRPKSIRNYVFGGGQFSTTHTDFNLCNNEVENFSNIKDIDAATYAMTRSGSRDFAVETNRQKGMLIFDFDFSILSSKLVGTIASSDPTLYWRIDTESDWTYKYESSPVANGYRTCIYIAYVDSDDVIHKLTHYDGTDIFDDTVNSRAIPSTLYDGNDFLDVIVYVLAEIEKGSTSELLPYEDTLQVKELYLKVPMTLNCNKFEAEPEIWWSGSGRKMGSDIGDRAGMPAAASDAKYTSIMVEKILREDLGVATADIDTGSFDDVLDVDYTGHLVLDGDDVVSSETVIRELSENSNFIFFYDPVNKAKVIHIYTNPASADKTITLNDLASDLQVVGISFDKILSSIVADYSYNKETKKYDKRMLLEPASDIFTSKIGAREATARFRIADDDVIETAGDMAIVTTNLFHEAKNEVRFSTKGFRCAEVEVGDTIEFDNTTVGAVMKYEGGSWSGVKFLIISKNQRMDSTEFIGITR